MIWTKITIDTTSEAVDMISYSLGELGIEGIEVVDKVPLSQADIKAMFIDILPDNIPEDDGLAQISCYVNSDDSIDSIIANIKKELEDIAQYVNIGTGKITVGETEDKDWINNWKEFFKPFRLYDDIVIKPTWIEEDISMQDDLVINIDPGTAFGTGAHETTKLCIGQLKNYINDSCEVFDAGCGSGILSIIALKLGAKNALAVDIDPEATTASLSNAQINGIDLDKIDIRQGDVIGDKAFASSINKKFDVVVANILADVIIPLSSVVKDFLKPDGVFIASGIINTKENAVKEAIKSHGLEIVDTIYMKDWVCIVAK